MINLKKIENTFLFLEKNKMLNNEKIREINKFNKRESLFYLLPFLFFFCDNLIAISAALIYYFPVFIHTIINIKNFKSSTSIDENKAYIMVSSIGCFAMFYFVLIYMLANTYGAEQCLYIESIIIFFSKCVFSGVILLFLLKLFNDVRTINKFYNTKIMEKYKNNFLKNEILNFKKEINNSDNILEIQQLLSVSEEKKYKNVERLLNVKLNSLLSKNGFKSKSEFFESLNNQLRNQPNLKTLKNK